MRDIQDCTERLAKLVELLTGSGRLDIRAKISPVGARPGSDEARLRIHFTGTDIPLLIANNGRVLDAIETLAADILGLSPIETGTLQFDAGSFLADRERRLRKAAFAAVDQVRTSGTPHVFPPMNSRDRRLLERSLITSGLSFETVGNQSTRWLILFPKDVNPSLESTSLQRCKGF